MLPVMEIYIRFFVIFCFLLKAFICNETLVQSIISIVRLTLNASHINMSEITLLAPGVP